MNQFQIRFDTAPATGYARRELAPLPELGGATTVAIDAETDLRPNHERKPCGFAYAVPGGPSGYISVNHPDSLNYDPAVVKRWLSTELRGKRVTASNAKHEAYVLQNFGIDPEALGVKWNDVFFQAALLDEKRYRINLDTLMREELGRGKEDLGDTEAWPIHERPADQVEPYAINDALGALELDAVYTPRIDAEDLGRVLQLENDLVYSTVEMERNGTFLDVELLDRWISEVKVEREARIWQIYKLTGLRISPTKRTDMLRLFAHLNLDNPFVTDKGEPSFDEEALLHFPQEPVRLALEVRQLESLLSKYLLTYRAAVDGNGLLRYELHQLRAESEGSLKGTISGRYSSSNVNIQQVSSKKKQPLLLQRWPVRQLFIAPPGNEWVSSDAKEIEYRIFAHYAAKLGMPRIAEAYKQDPKTSFHTMVVEWTGLIRDHAKTVSFCKLFGGGTNKIIETINRATADPTKRLSQAGGERLVAKYDRLVWEAKRTLREVSRVVEGRGYSRTILGRRRRFLDGEKTYAALNAICQGSAADTMKTKVLEAYRARKRMGLTMRMTVHDELDGTSSNPDIAREFTELLNTQSLPFESPILWDTGIGANWGEAH